MDPSHLGIRTAKVDAISNIDTRTVKITFFPDKAAKSLLTVDLTLSQLADRIAKQTAASKMELPWLKLAIFGNKRSEKGCLRTNANLVQITGIETEHDAGEISFDTAIAVMRKRRVRSLLYTSPSHMPETMERWRILVPLSHNYSPETRETLVARINGLFGGKIAPESFVLSQAYLFGRSDSPHHRVEVVDGDFLDLRDDLYAGSIFKDGSRVGDQAANHTSNGSGRQRRHKGRRDDDPRPIDLDKIKAALEVIDSSPYETWLRVGGALCCELGENGFEIFDAWSAKSPKYHPDECKEKWRDFSDLTEFTAGTIFYLADQADPGWHDRYLLDYMNGAFHAGTAGDAAGADAGNGQVSGEDPRAREEDERVANEAPVSQPLPVIKVRPRISSLTTETQKMLIDAKVPFYQRSGELVRPIIRTVKAAHGHLTRTAQLKAINPVYMRDTMCRHAHWMRFDGRRNEWIPTMAPMNVAETLLARDGVWLFSEIVGVIACPTMRPDGSLLVKQGYDPTTRLILIEPPAMAPIPDEPTRDDALRALALLEDLVCESPFEDEASKSVALSGLITPVVRGAMPVAPMHASSAPTAGTGKSFLWDLVAAISIGQRRIPVVSASNVEETEKRLAGVILTGQPLVSIDNVNGELKGDFLAQAIEQHYLNVRPLGASKIVQVEAGSTTIFATGNNITIVGDLCRRTITSRLDAQLESPQLRQFKNDPIQTILNDRGKYIAACLTICRAYVVAGRPGVLPRLASFAAWSDTVRSALGWLGKADPLDTLESTRADDPERSLLSEVLQAWAKVHGVGADNDVPLAVVVDKAMKMQSIGNNSNLELMFPDLHAAVRAAVGAVGNTKVDVRTFGRWCRDSKGRIVEGLCLRNRPSKRGDPATWWVEKQ